MSNLMNFRFHRGTLEESMRTLVQVANDAEAFCAFLNEWRKATGIDKWISNDFKVEAIRLREQGIDERIDWKESWLISVDGFGVIGHSDQRLSGIADENVVLSGVKLSMYPGGYHIDSKTGKGVKQPFDLSEEQIAKLLEEGDLGAAYYFTLKDGKVVSKYPEALDKLFKPNLCEETLQPGLEGEKTFLGFDPGGQDGYPDMALIKLRPSDFLPVSDKVIKDSPEEMLDDDHYRAVIGQYLTDDLIDDEKLKAMLPSIKECLLVILREHKRKIAAGEETIPELEARLKLDENRTLTDLCTVQAVDGSIGGQRKRVHPRDMDLRIISESTKDSMPMQPGDITYMTPPPSTDSWVVPAPSAGDPEKKLASIRDDIGNMDVLKTYPHVQEPVDLGASDCLDGAEWFEELRKFIVDGKNKEALIMIDSIPEHLQGMKDVKKGMVVLPDADTMTEQMVDATRGLHLYYVESTGGVSCENMRTHLNRYAPWSEKYWPEWFKTDNGHLTKAGRSIVAHALTIGAWKDPDARSNYFKEEQKDRHHVWDMPQNQYIQLEFKPCVMGEVFDGGGFKVAVPFIWARKVDDENFELLLNRSDIPKEHRKKFKTNCVKVSLKLTENYRAVIFGDIDVFSKYESSSWQVEPKMVSRFSK